MDFLYETGIFNPWRIQLTETAYISINPIAFPQTQKRSDRTYFYGLQGNSIQKVVPFPN